MDFIGAIKVPEGRLRTVTQLLPKFCLILMVMWLWSSTPQSTPHTPRGAEIWVFMQR